MGNFVTELKRRNVFRVAIAYVLVGWVLLQIADVLFPALGLPDWTIRFVAGLLLLGFPVALMFAWAFELTPDGLKREREVEPDQSITHHTGRKLDYIAIGLMVAILLWFAIDRFVLQPADSARPHAETEVADKSIAVLPFVNMSDDEANEYFSDGISEELLNLLARISELRVIGRTSSFQFKDKQEDLRLIADKLGVAHILEGSVRKSGNTVRVTAQLITATDGSHLWSDTFDRELDDIFKVQDEIAAAVVRALRVELLGESLRAADAPQMSEAYDLYLKGSYLLRRLNREDTKSGYQYVQQALEIDEELAPAWSELGGYYINEALDRSKPQNESLDLAWAATRKALEIDPTLAAGHYQSGFLELVFEWDWLQAEAAFDSVLAIEPNHTSALSGSGLLALGRGDLEAALDFQKRSFRADPLRIGTHHNLALTYYRAGDLEEALEYFTSSLELSDEYVRGRYYTSIVLLEMERLEEALAEAELEQGEAWRLAALALVYSAMGRDDDALAALEELKSRFADSAAYPVAQVYALRGEIDAAFVWLERGFEQHEPLAPFASTDPLLRNLKDDPRFAEYPNRFVRTD
jgi:TolB-like protein